MTTGEQRGRPLRFLLLLFGGWTAARVALLWPTIDSGESVIRAVVPIFGSTPAAADSAVPRGAAVAEVPTRPISAPPIAAAVPIATARPAAGSDPVSLALAVAIGSYEPAASPPPPRLVPGLPRPVRPTPSRWSISAWLVARSGANGATGTLGGGQLGGSQAGIRVAYMVDQRHRVALAGRVTSPLGRGLREAAVAVEWQPTRLPIRLVAEQRVAIAGGHGGPGAGVVGGFGPTPITHGFALEGYGEAGAIRRTRTEGYADGALRLAHQLAGHDRRHLDLGLGAWGGIQRGAERLDLGPSVSVSLPVGPAGARLSLDWRERVAGRARPGSGPALTLGADF